MDKTIFQDKCRGSLLGGAVGDALGYAVEFDSLKTIKGKYGECGITSYVTGPDGLALVSDDTQMSLFTADGLLTATEAGMCYENDILPYISKAYQHWYCTQTRQPRKMPGSFLTHVSRLWARRAPGMTCLSALQTIIESQTKPVNDSKGCGGVMRVAPIGIYSAAHPSVLNLEHAAYLAGAAAEVTHCHPLSTYSSMALAMIVADCLTRENIDRDLFKFIVIDRVFKLLRLYFPDNRHVERLYRVVFNAIWAATSEDSDTEAIRHLGEGWVAEETLAIALFSVMRYIDDFSRCITCAVNHDGDSDSTGAVAGNIIGAILGYKAIPEEFLGALELRDLLVSVADDLSGATPAPVMRERYVMHLPSGIDAGELL